MSNWLSKGHRMREARLAMLLADAARRTAEQRGDPREVIDRLQNDYLVKSWAYRAELCEMVTDCEEEISQIPEPQGKTAGDHTSESGV